MRWPHAARARGIAADRAGRRGGKRCTVIRFTQSPPSFFAITHRSQYDFIDGFARHMRDALPKASFIGFTGTPIEKEDKNTQAVFGDYIDVYDIQQAIADGATVRIYYESRLAK